MFISTGAPGRGEEFEEIHVSINLTRYSKIPLNLQVTTPGLSQYASEKEMIGSP